MNAKAYDGPRVARTRPARAGPNARAPVNCIEFTRTALSSADRGTNCGTNDCHAAVVMPAPRPEITTQPRIRGVVAAPVDQSSHRTVAMTMARAWAQISNQRRSWRSASDPASGPTTVAGKNAQNALTPTSAVEWVSWSTTNGTVTVCIHVPVFEINPAIQNVVNSRERNATRAPEGAGSGPGAGLWSWPFPSATAPNLPVAPRAPPRPDPGGTNICSGRVGVVAPHQRSLFAAGPLAIDDATPTQRIALDAASWVDVRRDWVRGSDALLDHLVETVEWRQGRRRMYDRVLDDPACRGGTARVSRSPTRSSSTWRRRSGGATRCRCMRSGSTTTEMAPTAVAFHADRELREVDDTLIAIVTLGARRPFLVRPKRGGRSVDVAPAGGDLLVMGGACQRGFEHGVPKVASAGPRISCTWRWARAT